MSFLSAVKGWFAPKTTNIDLGQDLKNLINDIGDKVFIDQGTVELEASRVSVIQPDPEKIEDATEAYQEESRSYYQGKFEPTMVKDAVGDELISKEGKLKKKSPVYDEYIEAALSARSQRDLVAKVGPIVSKFSKTHKVDSSSWKFLFSSMLREISKESLPKFLQKKWEELNKGMLPKDSKEFLALDAALQQNANLVDSLLKEWTKSIVEDDEKSQPEQLGSLMKAADSGIKHKESSEWAKEFAFKQFNTIAPEWGKRLFVAARGKAEYFSEKLMGFTRDQTELSIVKDLWKKFQGQISSEKFEAAYKKWDKFGLDFDTLESEILKVIK